MTWEMRAFGRGRVGQLGQVRCRRWVGSIYNRGRVDDVGLAHNLVKEI